MQSIEAVDHDAGPVAWREAGHGEVVLLLHGLGGTRNSWEPQLAALSGGWRCVAWDMPGYGLSAPLTQLSFAAIADAIVALLDSLGAERAHLCGLSFGGHQALHTVLRHPDRVASLVLADTSAAFGIDGTDAADWVLARTQALDAGVTPSDIADVVIRSIAGPGFGGVEFDRVVESFGRISTAGLRAACQCLVTHDVRSRLAEIVCPTLVIVGEHDAETPVSYSEILASDIADSRLEMIADVGHLTPSEAPDRFNQLVRTFLTETTVQA